MNKLRSSTIVVLAVVLLSPAMAGADEPVGALEGAEEVAVAAKEPVFCEHRRVPDRFTLVMGTEGDDVLDGTDADEFFCGLGGADVIRAGRGNDIILAGAGDDIVLGGAGSDRIFGGAGHDKLAGQTGRDRLFGNVGTDRLEGGPGRDRLIGGSGIDTCTDKAGITRQRGCEEVEVVVEGREAQLATARAKWAAQGVDEYALAIRQGFDVGVSIFDGTEVRGEGGVIATVDDLFSLAERATEVTFDREIGIPSRLEIEGEPPWEIVGFESRDQVRRELSAARNAWSDGGISAYAFTYQHVCFCAGVPRIRASVENGIVLDAVPVEDDRPVSIPPAKTMVEHFDTIEQLLDGVNASVTATFDARLGFPTSYSFDQTTMIADEEVTVVITDFNFG